MAGVVGEENTQRLPNRPARVGYAIARWRARRARADGCQATVIPYTGYGSQRWVRVLGRVLLAREPVRIRTGEPTGARGWRSFTSVPVENAVVVVEAAGGRHAVT